MAVPAQVQSMLTQSYAALADSITHNKPDVERSILASGYRDRATIKLDAYEYDPLTVVVQKIQANGTTMIVHAQWVGIGKNRENTIDRWLLLDGTWRLAERDKTRQ